MGPAAFPDDACSLRDGPPSAWRVGVAGGLLDTTLVFDGAAHADLRQWSALATASRRLSPGLSLQVGAGAILGGSLDDAAGRHRLAPGGAATAGLTWLIVPPRGGGPFVAATAALSLAASLPGRLDLLAEWAPLGARAVTVAIGRAL